MDAAQKVAQRRAIAVLMKLGMWPEGGIKKSWRKALQPTGAAALQFDASVVPADMPGTYGPIRADHLNELLGIKRSP